MALLGSVQRPSTAPTHSTHSLWLALHCLLPPPPTAAGKVDDYLGTVPNTLSLVVLRRYGAKNRAKRPVGRSTHAPRWIIRSPLGGYAQAWTTRVDEG
ncbi:hypothetical protein F5B22DRAFT_623723 [Xylaria bambusicola]|uniref:uncharacterized protein n=1 Tax=Xylaria bambusicola TaxID=326684 RepID=UPI002008C830|nr:uncharacterized protein F5B22DRAFT_623723 [Xylaria bambusicola]KAI0506463.1 hypothetical protein F5B22DRAFT_623723 [Xylaria bambusicola]